MNEIQKIFPELSNKRPLVIAGPCSAESEEQTLKTAHELADIGIKIFRAGLWKPRTKPGSFEGIGKVGLKWLAKVKSDTGMLVSTEVANKEHVELAISAGIDMLWIGARSSANPFAMQEIADSIKNSGIDIPIMVKNPINPDIELWIGAIERLYNAGVRRIGAIHRGFSIYGQHIYRNMPQWHIPIELHRRYPDLMIIGDPSHIGGNSNYVAHLSQQAMDMGFDGLIIESHCDPNSALSDREQQVTPSMLSKILKNLVIRNEKVTTENLTNLRQMIDEIDKELVELLSRRMNICREIGNFKKEHGMPVVQNERYEHLLTSRIEQGVNVGLGRDFLKKILESVHGESVRQQLDVINGK